MPTRIVTPPTVEPISLADVKTHLRIAADDTSQDDVLNQIIPDARAYAEQYTQRALATQTIEVTQDAFADVIELPYPPIQSIEFVKYIDSAGEEQDLGAEYYTLNAYAEPPQLVQPWDVAWPLARAVPNAVRIRYVAGYDDGADEPLNRIPLTLKRALLLLVGAWYEYPEAFTETQREIQETPTRVHDLLHMYRVGLGV